MQTSKMISYLRAGFPGFWYKTDEPSRIKTGVYEQLDSFVRKDGGTYKRFEWDCTVDPNPQNMLTEFTAYESNAVLFLYNFHWYIDKPGYIQFIQNNLPIWASTGKAIVVVSPKDKIPLELQREFVTLKTELPTVDEILETIHLVAPDDSFIPVDKDLDRLVSSCAGLGLSELKRVLALSLVEHERFERSTINEYRALAVDRTGFLTVLRPGKTFADIIGYDELKTFILETYDKPKAKGVMTIGPAGTGKTSLMEAIVAETGRLGIIVNTGKLFSKWQGETDANVDYVINFLSSVGECFCLIDEFEKQFSGTNQEAGEVSGGTGVRMGSRWLDFLQNRPQDVYICGTANTFVGIPPEYLRPGRWDSSPFFIGLPSTKVRGKILQHYSTKEGIELQKKNLPDLNNFTGAEIEALCSIAGMRGISLVQAAENIIPQAVSMAKKFKALNDWGKENCIPAEKAMSMKPNGKVNVDV